MFLSLIFVGTIVLFLAMAAGALWHLRWMQPLPPLDGAPAAALGATLCSVVIAARDEEARIEKTVRQLLAQTGVSLEIIVVDDRSTDGTSRILRELARTDPRLRVVRIDSLPEGWLGKCHACHLGASAAAGQWILFTDADCWMKTDLIARALRAATRDQADHIVLTPGIVVKTVAAQAWYLLFLISFSNWFSGVNRNRPRAYMGFGAFNFVRAEAYRQCGGYEALRLTVLDDLRLGLLLSRSGRRTRAFLGRADVECHWGTTLPELIRAMDKNYFAAADFRLSVVVGATMALLAILGILAGALWTASPLSLVAAAAPFLLCIPACVLARRVGWSGAAALAIPCMFLAFYYGILRSTFVTLRGGGVRWRDTFYPLALLRSGTVRE